MRQPDYPFVRRVVYGIINKMAIGNMDREDFVQIGMIAMMGAERNFRDDKACSLESYAAIRIRGAVLDEIRARAFVPRTEFQKSGKRPAQFVDLSALDSAHAPVADLELKISLRDLVSKLPDPERKVVLMRDYAGLTLMEISRLMNLSEGRISQIRSAAFNRLRKELSHEA